MTQIKRNLGYTIDQTILIVAIIAILITLIIATVGWDLISKSGGTKLAAQMRQIEDSVGQFYAEHRVWPHQGTTSGNNSAVIPRVLANVGSGYTLSGVAAGDVKNLLPGLDRNGTNLEHDFGAGGAFRMQTAAPASGVGIGTNTYYIAQMSGVPINEVEEADEIIDGSLSSTTGRLVYRATGNCYAGAGAAIVAGTATVNVCYFANIVN